MKNLKLLLVVLCTLFVGGQIFAQQQKPLAKLVSEAQFAQKKQFKTVPAFTVANRPSTFSKAVDKAQVLDADPAQIQLIAFDESDAITLNIPYHQENIVVDLVEVRVVSEQFKQSSSNGAADAAFTGKHFRGIVRGDDQSIAAFSFFEGQLMGLVSDKTHGNLVVGLVQRLGNTTEYIVYNDNQLHQKRHWDCAVNDDEFGMDSHNEPAVSRGGGGRCVRSFFEVDYDFYVAMGENYPATIQHITGLFNQVAGLFAQEDIPMVLTEIFVWVTPFDYTDDYNVALDKFNHNRLYFNGDLAHLISAAGELGVRGKAISVGTPCEELFRHSVNYITKEYEQIPTYSESVKLLAHEIGHLLGSRHTHWCGWPGGPIDGCGPAVGFPYEDPYAYPPCNPAPLPAQGGTIMSYCDGTSVGVNLSLGFGPLPGDAIRNTVQASECFPEQCCVNGSLNEITCVTDCPEVNEIRGVSVKDNVVEMAWSSVPNAEYYVLYYRYLGEEDWTSVATVPQGENEVPQFYGPFPCGATLEIAIKTNCGSIGNSGLSNGIILQIPECSSTCYPPSTITSTTVADTVTLYWGGNGVSSYNIRYRLANTTTWSQITAPPGVFNSVTIPGIPPGSQLIVQIRSVCGNEQSNITTAYIFTPLCATPTGVTATPISGTETSVTWNAVPGALGYVVAFRKLGGATWVYDTVQTNSALLSHLTAGITYEVHVRTLCFNNISVFSPLVPFTQPAHRPNGNRPLFADDLMLETAPNPVKNILNVSVSLPNEGTGTVYLVNTLGLILDVQPLANTQNRCEIDMTNFPMGVYQVRLVTDQGAVKCKQVVKVK